MKRRSLTCRSEDAQHPFRSMLAPQILSLVDIELAEAQVGAENKVSWWQHEDTHLFMLSFCAFFVVFYTFIA